jgi:hypothetical protein
MTSSIPTLVFDERDDELSSILNAARRAIQAHPIAAQAIFAALAAEGRRFAETPEGREWKERLAGSDLLERARLVWDTVSLTAITEDASEPLPSAYLEGVLRAAAVDALEPLLSRLFDEGV